MAGAAVLLVASLVYAVLLDALRRRDRGYPSTRPADSHWWFGYARDAANVAGWLMFAAGFALLAFTAAESLFLGAATALLAYGLDFWLSRVRAIHRAPLALWLLLAVVIAAVVGFRDALARGLHDFRALLF